VATEVTSSLDSARFLPTHRADLRWSASLVHPDADRHAEQLRNDFINPVSSLCLCFLSNATTHRTSVLFLTSTPAS
jgi:hypothetical protein